MTRTALAFAVVLAAWGNVTFAALAATATLPGGSAAFAVAGVALVLFSLAVARSARVPLSAVLGEPHHAARGGAIGMAAGIALAAASVWLLRFAVPPVTGTAVRYEPLAGLALGELARHALVLLPLGVVLPEEVAFRGTLLALLERRYAARQAVALSAVAFAAWHLVVIVTTIAQTTLGSSIWAVPAAVVAAIVVLAGGVVLALLRLRTRTIATAIAAHWAFNSALLAGLWLGASS